MAIVTLIIGLAAFWEQSTETPQLDDWSLAKAYQASASLVEFQQEKWEGGEWFLGNANRAYLFLKSLEREVFFKTGNEVGDPLLREIIGEPIDRNHTPFLNFRYREDFEEQRWGVEFYQPDHMSDALKRVRIDRVGQNPWEANLLDRRAWFGENLPHLSLAGAYYDYESQKIAIASQLQMGWRWRIDPVTQVETPFFESNLKEQLRYKSFSGELLLEDYQDVSRDSLVNWKRVQWTQKFESEFVSLKLKPYGIFKTAKFAETKGAVGISPELEIHYQKGNRDGEFQFLSQGSKWRSKAMYLEEWGDWERSLSLGFLLREEANHPAAGTENQEGYHLESLENFAFEKKLLEGDYSLLSVYQSKPFGHFSWKLKGSVGLQRGMIYFEPISYFYNPGVLGKENPYLFGRWEREGEFRVKNSWYPKTEASFAMQVRPVYQIQWELEGLSRWHTERDQLYRDYEAPDFELLHGMSVLLPFELRIVFRNRWQSGYTIKKISPEEFVAKASWEHDLGLIQYLFKRSLVFDLRLLNVFNEEERLHPNGNFARFRLLSSLTWTW